MDIGKMIREAERAVASTINKKGLRKPVDLARSGQQITNLVGHGPCAWSRLSPVKDSMATTLLRRFGVPQVPVAEGKATKECESPATVPDDALE
jgi:hypothetical protein